MVLRAANLSNVEARFFVAAYYKDQDDRKRADMQLRHLGDRHGDDSAILLKYVSNVHADTEDAIFKMLDKFSTASPVGRWARAQLGIGPVIVAGLLAHIDITRAPTAGHIWSFAGLNPQQKWEKGEKRPYNPKLKQVCFHMGESFKKVSNNPGSLYGSIYRSRKKLVEDRNAAGYNTERAKIYVTRSADQKKLLSEGKLPQGNLDRQACNYAVKIFLSHLQVVLYWDHYGKIPPAKPYAISILGHAHEIKIPNLEFFPGLAEAYYGEATLAAAE
jgi:hypothetical protein